jgi:hypothetical protein
VEPALLSTTAVADRYREQAGSWRNPRGARGGNVTLYVTRGVPRRPGDGRLACHVGKRLLAVQPCRTYDMRVLDRACGPRITATVTGV